MALERLAHRDALRRLERTRLPAAESRTVFAPATWAASARSAAQSSISRASGAPTRYHSSIVNSGACSAVRSRLRKTCDREKICVSPAASSFFIANSGDVCSQASLAEPSGRTSAVRNPCRWVSLPGEAWRAAVSTSTKPFASNHRRTKSAMRVRASSRPRRSAWRSRLQNGGEAGRLTGLQRLLTRSGRPGWPSPPKSVYSAAQLQSRRLKRSDPSRKSGARQISRTKT